MRVNPISVLVSNVNLIDAQCADTRMFALGDIKLVEDASITTRFILFFERGYTVNKVLQNIPLF